MATIFNTITTTSGRVTRILNFLESGTNFYVGIGKATPWDASFGSGVSDLNPPSPTPGTIILPEPIVYKKVCCVAAAARTRFCDAPVSSTGPSQNLCPDTALEDSNILIEESYTDQNFTYYAANEITIVNGQYNVFPEFVYVKGQIEGEEYIEDGWRASALFTQLVLADGVPTGQDIYQPNQVVSGIIQQMTYNTFVERQDGKSHRFEYIINV